MAQRHWKFHDYDMLLNHSVKVYGDRVRFDVVYVLTHLPYGSCCLVCGDGTEKSRWLRKTRNEGSDGSTRYASFDSLDEALSSGVAWARRKDEEAAAS